MRNDARANAKRVAIAVQAHASLSTLVFVLGEAARHVHDHSRVVVKLSAASVTDNRMMCNVALLCSFLPVCAAVGITLREREGEAKGKKRRVTVGSCRVKEFLHSCRKRRFRELYSMLGQ